MPDLVKMWTENILLDMQQTTKNLSADSINKNIIKWNYLQQVSNCNKTKNAPRKMLQSSDYDYIRIFHDSIDRWNSQGKQVFLIIDGITGNSDLDQQFRDNAEYDTYYLYDWKRYSVVVRSVIGSSFSQSNLISSKWHQGYPYNTSCPRKGVENYYVGCGPLAMGRIMHYFKYPSLFNWENMPDGHCTNTTADFLHEIGVKANAKYGSHGLSTSTTIDNIVAAFRYYGYNAVKQNYSNVAVVNQINKKIPVYLRASYVNGKTGKTVQQAWIASGASTFDCHVEYQLWTFSSRNSFRPFGNAYCNDYQGNTMIYMEWGGNEGQYNGFYSTPFHGEIGHSFKDLNMIILNDPNI